MQLFIADIRKKSFLSIHETQIYPVFELLIKCTGSYLHFEYALTMLLEYLYAYFG